MKYRAGPFLICLPKLDSSRNGKDAAFTENVQSPSFHVSGISSSTCLATTSYMPSRCGATTSEAFLTDARYGLVRYDFS